MRFLLGIILAVTFYTSAYGTNGSEPAIYHLRAPRSGSHWFFYCVNTLFGKGIYYDGSSSCYRDNSYLRNEGKIVSAHNPYDLHLDKDSRNKDLLILLIRNYRECLIREYEDPELVKNEILYQASFNPLSHDNHWVLNLRMNHYFHNLRVYDIWNPEKRIMVYYEDLLQKPQETLQKLADFLGEKNKEVEISAFIDKIDVHMENSIKIYEGPNKGYISHTRGRSFLYHTNKIGLIKSRELDELVYKCFPDFFNKYLSTYSLDSEQ
jgi:hypothetical protein